MFVPKTGLVVAGYELLRCVGRGGFGVVFAAQDAEHQRVVAIKLMRPPGEKWATTSGRFRREVEIVRKLDHPRIIEIYDAGEIEDGALYYVMEFLDGYDLSDHLASGGALRVRDAIEIAQQALEALGVAHDAGVVHRDVKPANIFLRGEARDEIDVKVLDFGIATMPDDPDQETLTGTGRIVGTPKYMAPESVLEGICSSASDVYAMGLVLLEMLNGKPVFDGPVHEILRAQALRFPELPRAIRSTALEWWFEKVLSKDPEFRYADAATARKALLGVLEQLGDLADTRLADHEPAAHHTAQVVLTAADRVALARAVRDDDPTPADEATVSKIVAVEPMDDARWEQEVTPVAPAEHHAPETAPLPVVGESATAPLPAGLDLEIERGPVTDWAEAERKAAAARAAEQDNQPPPPPSTVSTAATLATLALLMGMSGLVGLVVSSRSRKSAANVDPAHFRVESKPPGAFFTIDATAQGRTPQVIRWPADEYPIVIEFRHPNGGQATEFVETPRAVVSVTLRPPRTRPDSPPSEPRPPAQPSVEQVGARKGGARHSEPAAPPARHDAVNREIAIASEGWPTSADPFDVKPRPSNGVWWADTQAALTELAQPCLPDRLRRPRDSAAPRPPLIVSVTLTVSASGRVLYVKADRFGDTPPPPASMIRCLERTLVEQAVPPPPELATRREVIPLMF